LGVDLLTLNGAKIGGPAGMALLYVRRGTPIAPMLYGGGQERGLRSGTENILGAVGFAKALNEVQEKKEKESARLTTLRDHFVTEIKKNFTAARLNGSLTERLPNNVNVSFPRMASELIVLELDARGISASAGSACASAKTTGSHVLEALYGKGDEKEWGTVRFSFGPETVISDFKTTEKALTAILEKYGSWNK
jgi:cysteine desulfurase